MYRSYIYANNLLYIHPFIKSQSPQGIPKLARFENAKMLFLSSLMDRIGLQQQAIRRHLR